MKKNINKKLLKEEIDRFLEIMNIKLSNPILNESVSSVSLLKNFIVNAGKTEFDKLISSSASKNFLKVINRKYIQQSNDWSRTIDSLTETELAKLFATIDFDKLAKKIIENPNFTAVNYNNRLTPYRNYVRQIVTSGQTASAFQVIANQLYQSKYFQNLTRSNDPLYVKLDKAANKIFVDDFKKYIKNNHKDVWEKIGKDITQVKVADAVAANIGQWEKDLKDAGLTKSEIFFLTNNLPFISTRGVVQDFLTARKPNEEKYLSQLDDTLQYVIKNVMVDLNPELYTAEFKKINLILENLMQSNEEVRQLIYNQIQSSLNSKYPGNYDKINMVMKKLKDNNVLDKNYELFWPRFYKTTYAYNMWNPNAGIQNKEDFITPNKRGLNTIYRIGMFLATGNLRKVHEYYDGFIRGNKPIVFGGKEYYNKYGVGFLKMVGWLSLVKWVFVPLVFSFIGAIFYWASTLRGNMPKTTLKAFWDILVGYYKHKTTVIAGGLAEEMGLEPGSFNWFELIPFDAWGIEVWNLLESGNMGAFKKWVDQKKVDVENKSKEMLDNAKTQIETKTKKVVTSIGGKIANNPKGFEAFCSWTKDAEFRKKHGIDKEYTFKSFNPTTEIGETTDGRTWAFDGNTFTEY